MPDEADFVFFAEALPGHDLRRAAIASEIPFPATMITVSLADAPDAVDRLNRGLGQDRGPWATFGARRLPSSDARTAVTD